MNHPVAPLRSPVTAGSGPAAPALSWREFERLVPEFAARARELLASRKHLTLATLRRDGSPRISGTEVQFRDDDLVIGSMPGSVKGQDLLRDARVAIHGPTSDPPKDDNAGWIGEAKVSGVAERLADADGALFFAIRLREVVITHLNPAGDRVVVESWTVDRGLRTLERE